MVKHKKRSGKSGSIGLFLLVLLGLGLCIAMLLQGTDVALFNPKGLIASEQLRLMTFATVVMLVIAVPTLTLLYFFAWKYRESNATATYESHTRHGKFFLFSIWAIPSVFLVVLASVMWSATHRLEPQKPIAADAKPLTIQVVAMRWKWLFIYPEQNIASVNFVQFPTNTPVKFELTADEAPMNSFWIPHLSGQLYAMTGHVNPLNLIADTPGDYPGSAAEINGAGFAGMKFTARASSQDEFDRWVQDTKASTDELSSAEYSELLEPSENNQVAFYRNPDTEIYSSILSKYAGSHKHYTESE